MPFTLSYSCSPFILKLLYKPNKQPARLSTSSSCFGMILFNKLVNISYDKYSTITGDINTLFITSAILSDDTKNPGLSRNSTKTSIDLGSLPEIQEAINSSIC